MNAARPLHRTDTVELGDLPPLLTTGARGLPDRRSVSIRWLTGTVLATIASTFLMGGALYAAFDGRDGVTALGAMGGFLAALILARFAIALAPRLMPAPRLVPIRTPSSPISIQEFHHD